MKSNPFNKIVDEGDFSSWQVLMSELDTTLKRMRYISLKELNDAYEIELFNNFWSNIKTNEAVVVSVTDNCDLYEISDDSIMVILSEDLNDKMIIFDIQDNRKIMERITKQIENS